MVRQDPVADLITMTLNYGAYATRTVTDVAEALHAIREWTPHLAIIEVEDRLDPVMKQLRQPREGYPGGIPVLGLTQRGDLRTKLRAFDEGMDDIMTIPFSAEELLARMLALTRRAFRQPFTFRPVIKVGVLEIDILNRQVRMGDEVLRLTPLEQSLLYFLAANNGRTLTRDQITDAIWGMDLVPESNIVDRHIRNLRAKLEKGYPGSRFITTVPGRGYRFAPMIPEPGALL